MNPHSLCSKPPLALGLGVPFGGHDAPCQRRVPRPLFVAAAAVVKWGEAVSAAPAAAAEHYEIWYKFEIVARLERDRRDFNLTG